MILIQQKYFSDIECDKIIDITKDNTQFWNLGDRKYTSQRIIDNQNTNWIYTKLKKFFEENTNHIIKHIKNDIHFHTFQENDFFYRHNDSRKKRLFAIGLLLNDNFDGGDFVFHNEGEIKVIDKIKGTAYLFDVDYEHEITKITNGNRYSIIWFLERDNVSIKKMKLI